MGTAVRMTVSPVGDLSAVAPAWRALEAEAGASFFQSWTWVGCLAEERFSDPVLLQVERGGRVVGLALFNRRRERWGTESLWLHQSGDRALDSVFIEHNGLLLTPDSADLLPACLEAVLAGTLPSSRGWRRTLGSRLRLGGVDPRYLLAAERVGRVVLSADSFAPYVDLAALADAPDAYLSSLSANTRYQIRRSDRCLARVGPVTTQSAATVPEALAWFDALAALHQGYWAQRGEDGAFSTPEFLQFHRALIGRALPRGELVLLRMTVGPHVLGYLYNFRLGDRVLNYQSGFDYDLARELAGPHAKPGLSCHHAAILRARAEGAAQYDFLAGVTRFKSSLAHHRVRVCWFDVAPRFSVRGAAYRLHSAWQNSPVSATVRRMRSGAAAPAQ